MATLREVLRIEKWEDGGTEYQRVSKGDIEYSGPADPHPTVKGVAQDEWDNCFQILEDLDMWHLVDTVKLRDHCLKIALAQSVDPDATARRTAYHIMTGQHGMTYSLKHGANGGGAADESYVPA